MHLLNREVARGRYDRLYRILGEEAFSFWQWSKEISKDSIFIELMRNSRLHDNKWRTLLGGKIEREQEFKDRFSALRENLLVFYSNVKPFHKFSRDSDYDITDSDEDDLLCASGDDTVAGSGASDASGGDNSDEEEVPLVKRRKKKKSKKTWCMLTRPLPSLTCNVAPTGKPSKLMRERNAPLLDLV